MNRRRYNWPLLFGLVLALALATLLLLPLFFDLANPHEAQREHLITQSGQGTALKPGDASDHPLGTDAAGRDLLARLVYGGRLTLGIAVLVTAGRALLSLPLGLWAGWRGGWAAAVCGSVFAGVNALPALFVLLVSLTAISNMVYRPNHWTWLYFTVMIITGVPRLAEQIRQSAFQVKALPFVEGGIAIGAPLRVLLQRYVLRSIRGEMWPLFTAEASLVLFTMAQLSLLGLNPGKPVPLAVGSVSNPIILRITGHMAEWGQMFAEHVPLIVKFPYMVLFPALALALSILCFQFLAEGLRRSVKGAGTWYR